MPRVRTWKVLPVIALAALLLPAAPAEAKPGKNKIDVWMVNTGADPDANGRAKLFTNANRDRFRIKVKNLDVGQYDVLQGGVLAGVMDVKLDDDGSGTRGDLRWDSKKGNPLDFDPRGQTIEVAQGGTVFLMVDFPASQTDMRIEIEVELDSTGFIPGAEGEAEFESKRGRMEFEIEIEDVPAGDYTLRVDGSDVATITVTERADGTLEGEVEFSSRPEDDELLLTFDPRGKLIEVLLGADVVLSKLFPAGP